MSKTAQLAEAVLATMKESPMGSGFTIKWLRTLLQKNRDHVYDALRLLERDGKVRRDSLRGHWKLLDSSRPSVAALLEASRQSGPVISLKTEEPA